MSEEFFLSDWEEVFSDLKEAKEMLQRRLFFEGFEELVSARLRVSAQGYAPPYGSENIWGIGFGFKGFPPDSTKSWVRFLEAARGFPIPIPLNQKWIANIFSRLNPERCIKVFVGQKARPEEVEVGFRIGAVMEDLYPHVRTDVVEIGRFRPISYGKTVRPGLSGGNIGLSGGTIGAVVKEGNSDVLLSCAHVFVDFGNMRNKNIIQPSSSEGGRPPSDLVGRLESYIDLRFDGRLNEIDAATASIDSGVTPDPTIPNAPGPVSGRARNAGTGEMVWKVGAATSDTYGIVVSGAIDVQGIPYPWGYANFTEVYAIYPYMTSFPPSPFSAVGDSGTIVVGNVTGDVLGLAFADSPKYRHALVCKSTEVERQLRISF